LKDGDIEIAVDSDQGQRVFDAIGGDRCEAVSVSDDVGVGNDGSIPIQNNTRTGGGENPLADESRTSEERPETETFEGVDTDLTADVGLNHDDVGAHLLDNLDDRCAPVEIQGFGGGGGAENQGNKYACRVFHAFSTD
jgi:hypothetical protein